MTWIKAHFQRYRKREPWSFCWRIAIEGTFVGLLAGIVFGLFGLGRDLDLDFPFLTIVFLVVIVAPVIETLIFQAFPVWIARLCKARFSVQVAASVIPFFLVHAVEGIATGIAAGLIGGYYFAFTYVHWREQRRWTAYWTTAVSHAIHNAIAISLVFSLGEI